MEERERESKVTHHAADHTRVSFARTGSRDVISRALALDLDQHRGVSDVLLARRPRRERFLFPRHVVVSCSGVRTHGNDERGGDVRGAGAGRWWARRRSQRTPSDRPAAERGRCPGCGPRRSPRRAVWPSPDRSPPAARVRSRSASRRSRHTQGRAEASQIVPRRRGS
jgi:hypothetical protein